MPLTLSYDPDRLGEICRRHHVSRLEVFGSQARGDALPGSDIDVLVSFAEGKTPGWEFVALKEELQELFNLPVDLLTRRMVECDENELFRASVLSAVELIFDDAA